VQDKGTRRKRYNHELYELFEPNIAEHIQINRQSRAGQVTRMENSGTDKKAFDTGPEGTREPGGPKLRWEDGAMQDIRQGFRSEELEECG
jgi:hypothetical protein